MLKWKEGANNYGHDNIQKNTFSYYVSIKKHTYWSRARVFGVRNFKSISEWLQTTNLNR